MSSRFKFRTGGLLLSFLLPLVGQEVPLDPHSSVKIDLPPDSPLTLISAENESRAASRGSAVVLDLHMKLAFRNASPNRVRGVTLLFVAQEVTPGGRASVSVPALDIAPGQVFTLPVNNVQLLRPAMIPGGALVQVSLDGVLFNNLQFFGPNRLDSRRSLTAWELEAQRDRQYFKSILAMQGPAGLQHYVLDSLARQAERPRLNVQVSRGRSVSAAALGPEQTQQFAFLEFPDSPVQPVEGSVRVAGNEARAPRIEVRNRSSKPVKYFEIGWIVRDRSAGEFLAASVPASDPDLRLLPGRTAKALQDTALKFSRAGGEALRITGMTAFVSQVEYTDGEVWVPNRASLQNASLLRVMAPSPEEQRLTDLYRKKGPRALLEELNKF